MKRIFGVIALLIILGSCADPATGPASGATEASSVSPSPTEPARVDLVEAGIRAVLPSDGGSDVLFVLTDICDTEFTNDERTCEDPLTGEEQAVLAERLGRMAERIEFYPRYEDIPKGEAPMDTPGAVVVWVGPPRLRDDGTYQVEAGETCGGPCGHGSTYALEEREGGWVSTGNAPGTGQWIS